MRLFTLVAQWLIQDVPDRGATPKGVAQTSYLVSFHRKLHENKEMSAKGARPFHPRSANVEVQKL